MYALEASLNVVVAYVAEQDLQCDTELVNAVESLPLVLGPLVVVELDRLACLLRHTLPTLSSTDRRVEIWRCALQIATDLEDFKIYSIHGHHE